MPPSETTLFVLFFQHRNGQASGHVDTRENNQKLLTAIPGDPIGGTDKLQTTDMDERGIASPVALSVVDSFKVIEDRDRQRLPVALTAHHLRPGSGTRASTTRKPAGAQGGFMRRALTVLLTNRVVAVAAGNFRRVLLARERHLSKQEQVARVHLDLKPPT